MVKEMDKDANENSVFDNAAFIDDDGNTRKTEDKKEIKNESTPLKSFFQLYRFADGVDACLMLFGVACSILTGCCVPVNTLIFGELTDAMVERARANHSHTEGDNITETFYEAVKTFSIGNSILGSVLLLFSYLSVLAFNQSAQRQIYRIRVLFFKSILSQNIGWYDLNSTGDFSSRVSDDLNKLEDGFGEKVVLYIHLMTAFFGGMIMALIKGWKLALICMSSLPLTSITMLIMAKLMTKFSKSELETYGRAGIIAEEALSSIRTVMAFGGQEKEIKRYNENLVEAKNNNIKRQIFHAAGLAMFFFFIYCSYAMSFWYGINMVYEEIYSAGEMTTVSMLIISASAVLNLTVIFVVIAYVIFFSVMMGSMYFGMAAPFIEVFSSGKAAAEKVFSIIDKKSEIDPFSETGQTLEKVKGEIEFRKVHFSYPSRSEVNVLNGISLRIKKGQTVALVGSSGCGKSTCIQLIQRFYDPLEGEVLLDGINIKDLNIKFLRKQIGVVGQEPVLFAAPIVDNIRYSDEQTTMEDVIKASKMANAHDFIVKLPQGYNTMVGERGVQFSGGQKQRIAIARALVRNPCVLLLDEATSALDTVSEAKVQAALDNASKGRTTIIVAHRLSTIRRADRIIVLSKGEIVEEGTHEELMRLGRQYFQLVTAQIGTLDEEQEDIGKLSENNRKESVTSCKSVSFEFDENVQMNQDSTDEDEDYRSPSLLIDILKLNSSEWVFLTLGTVASLASGFCPPVFAIVFGEIMGVFELPKDEAIELTKTYCLYFMSIGIFIGVITFTHIWAYGVAGEILTMKARSLSFSAMMKQEIAWFDMKHNSVGALCSRLSSDASNIQGATGQRIGTIIQSFGTMVLAIVLSMIFQWKLGLLSLAFTPFLIGTTFLALKIVKGHTFGNQKALEKSSKIAVESIGNIRTVASLGREPSIIREFIAELKPMNRTVMINNHMRGIMMGFSRSVIYFAYAGCMFYGAQLIENENVEYKEVYKVTQMLLIGSFSVANALAFTPNLQKGLMAAVKMFKLLKRVPKVRDLVDDDDVDSWAAKGNVCFNAVHFNYPSRPEVKVLRDLSLRILDGKNVALVGHSGCGKSTLIQMLERFYDPDKGDVVLDSRSLKSLKLINLRNQLGIVSQEPVLFDRTIAENIAYGDNTREVPMEEIIDAAQQANIHTFITSLPLGYQTRLGEKGVQLSGGQKQRIAIARALIRRPKVLLLDEATSALDTQSEKVVQEALDQARAGRTCITIAHRLSTIQDADLIVVINMGTIAEMGTHSELLEKKGIYRQLYMLQSGIR